MKTANLTKGLVTGLVLATCWASMGFSETLPQEPDEGYLVNEDINIMTGLYIREYSLTKTGVVDYRTARQIIMSEYNEYWNSVVETKAFPLFYWYDADHDGHFAMWVDRKVEGCSCDIQPYDAAIAKQP